VDDAHIIQIRKPQPGTLGNMNWRQNGGYASSHDCRVNCGLRSADREGAQVALSGSTAAAARG